MGITEKKGGLPVFDTDILNTFFRQLLKLTLSRRHDVANVAFLPSPRADKTLRTSSPQRQVGRAGVRGFYIIMRAGLKGLTSGSRVRSVKIYLLRRG